MDDEEHKELLDICQPGASEHEKEGEVPRLYVLLYRLRWHIRNKGYLATAKRVARRLFSAFSGASETTGQNTKKRVIRPALNLKPGELVEVRSAEEIRETLDATGRDRGLAFMSQMDALCGKRFRVLKPVKNIMVDEFASTARLRPIKEVVVLEGAICNGAGLDCDRCCYFFWKESWLKRVNGTQEATRRDALSEIRNN